MATKKDKYPMREFGDGIGWALDKAKMRRERMVFLTFFIGLILIVYGLVVMNPAALIVGGLILSSASIAGINQ